MNRRTDGLTRLAAGLVLWNLTRIREAAERAEFRRAHGYDEGQYPSRKPETAGEIIRRVWRILRA